MKMKKAIALILALCTLTALPACEKQCEHTYTNEITRQASCTEEGVMTFTCSLCDHSFTEPLPMLDHTFGTATESKKPTCTQEGEKSASCTICGFSKVVDKIPVIKHAYHNVVTKVPTCSSAGEQIPTCECGATGAVIYVDMIAHSYSSKITKAATYKQTGIKEFTCSGCGKKYTETIAKLSTSEILSAATEGSSYITTSLNYMSDALNYYKKGKHTSGRDATGNMLLATGFAINHFKEARDLCGNHPDLAEVKTLLSNIISELEYVQKYDTITSSNYLSIVMDIYYENTYQDAHALNGQLITLFAEFV